MFRPSQKLLFSPVPVLNKLKIHQPLPLSPRESRQLLNILTRTFQQHLDKEHPSPSKHSDDRQPRPRSHSRRASNSIDHHMRSVLTNPLFTPPQKNGQEVGRDPMAVFDRAVSLGMMDAKQAYVCLCAKRQEIVHSPVLNIRDGMRDSGAGRKVLKWLVSSGSTKNLEFLNNQAFAAILIEFMVAEGLQEIIWTWITRALEDAHLKPSPNMTFSSELPDAIRPLMLLIQTEARAGEGLDTAYTSLSRAASYLKGSAMEQSRLLRHPTFFLYGKTLQMENECFLPSESTFESFLGLIPVAFPNSTFMVARLSLLHPTKPNADLALSFLRRLDETPGRQFDAAAMTRKVNGRIHLSLLTAKVLLENERFSEAEWVMDFISRRYSKELCIFQNKSLDQARAEASSLELLEGLSLA